MKFSAVFNSIQKGMHKFQGSIKKEVEIPGVFKKNSCRISMGLGFWPWNFQEVSHKFAEFLVTKACFPGISKSIVTNLTFPGGISEKYIVNPPCLDFSMIAQ